MSPSSHKIVVTKPCQQAWSSMIEADNGRYCKSCDKIVIDFSVVSDDEIRSFFLKNSSDPVCGRFHKSQLDRIRINIPSYVLRKPIPFWKKFLIIFLICFGSNLYLFDTFVNGKPALYAQSSSKKPARKKIHTHRTKNIMRFTEIPIEVNLPREDMFTMGATITRPSNEIVYARDIPDIKTDSSPTNSDTLLSRTAPGNGNTGRKKSPGKQNSENTNAYILPPGLKYRRRKPQSK